MDTNSTGADDGTSKHPGRLEILELKRSDSGDDTPTSSAIDLASAFPEEAYAALARKRRKRVERYVLTQLKLRASSRSDVGWMREHVDAKHLAQEPDLTATCWPAYGYMSPVQRTRLFAQIYQEEIARALGKPPIVGVLLDGMGDGAINALWQGRMVADSLGLPYDIYLAAIIKAHLQQADGKHLPQPNQLFGKTAVPRTRNLLNPEVLGERLYTAGWDERLLAESYTGDMVQKHALKLALKAISGSPDPAKTLREFVIDRRGVPLAVAKQHFRGIAEAALGPVALGRQGPRDRPYPNAPGCLGLFPSPPSSACGGCLLVTRCRQIENLATAELIEQTGSPDPRTERRKRLIRERVRRHRAKNRVIPPQTADD